MPFVGIAFQLLLTTAGTGRFFHSVLLGYRWSSIAGFGHFPAVGLYFHTCFGPVECMRHIGDMGQLIER